MLYALITFGVFITMEGITWCTHKYVMHGFGWFLHEDHHQPGYPNIFEKNDLFFVIFAFPSMLLFIFGSTRDASLGRKIFFGVAIGLSFELISRIGGALALSFDFSPLLSSFVPAIAIIIIATTVLINKSIH